MQKQNIKKEVEVTTKEVEKNGECVRCGNEFYDSAREDGHEGYFERGICRECRHRLPIALVRAMWESEDGRFMLRLRTGEKIRFRSADIYGDFVVLDAQRCKNPDIDRSPNAPASSQSDWKRTRVLRNRRFEVRVDDIVWCAEYASEEEEY